MTQEFSFPPNNIPPYGLMPEETFGSGIFVSPDSWAQIEGPDWDEWILNVVKLLSAILWPRFSNGAWHGGAKHSMLDLTEADFILLKDLRRLMPTDGSTPDQDSRERGVDAGGRRTPMHVPPPRRPRPGPVFGRRAIMAAGTLEPLHVPLPTVVQGIVPVSYRNFLTEDSMDTSIQVQGGARSTQVTDMMSLPRTLKTYLQAPAQAAFDRGVESVPCDDGLTDYFAANYPDDMESLAGTTDIQLKMHFMRPRPYQMAVLLNRHQGDCGFTYLHASTAMTPSMVSGHCLQAALGGVGANTRLIALPNGIAPAGTAEKLMHHSVDVGDRRVMAGVHYPSDNLGSWITALLMTNVLDKDGISRKFLWDAISNRSTVYAHINLYKPPVDGRNPYAAPLGLLNAIGTGKITSVEDALEWIAKAG